MKIIDSNNEEEVDKFLKSQAKHIYAAEYNIQNQKQIKKQFEIISNELINNIISCKDNDSSKGYIDLKKKLID